MGIHIVVCIKQTPASTNVQIDPETGTLKREGSDAAINPFDEFAIEEAVRLKERIPGSSVSALTMGPPKAEDILRDAIARGCDQAFHITSRAFAGSDTWATSYTLSKGIEKISQEKGAVHLVLCGKQTNDGDTGHIGPGVGAWLDWPNVAYIRKVDEIDDKHVVVHRLMEDGVDVLDMTLPAVISVVKEINEPRVASLKGKMNAKKAVIAKWDENALGCDPASIGLKGSPTVVARSFVPPPRKGGERIQGATVEEKAKNLVDKLQEMKLI